MKSEILKQFGKHVHHLRQLQDLSQEILAEKVNMHRTYIGMIERGERNPALLNLIRLASALDISLPELLRTMLMTETVIMNLTDSYGFFRENIGRTLGDLKLEYQTRFPKFTSEMKINKGEVGQFIKKLIGLKNTNALTDFADGELKSNKADKDGAPLETMFISQISSNFDQLISDQISFEDSWIYQKIKNLLYVPICKVGNDPDQWYIQSAYHVQINEGGELFRQLADDFTQIKSQLLSDINSENGYIHTSSGVFIQIRSKDSKPYSPIFSAQYDQISNKNHAFYFKKEFMREVREMARQGRDGVVRII